MSSKNEIKELGESLRDDIQEIVPSNDMAQHQEIVATLQSLVDQTKLELQEYRAVSIMISEVLAQFSEHPNLIEVDFNQIRDMLHSVYLSKKAFYDTQNQFIKVSDHWAKHSGFSAVQKATESRLNSRASVMGKRDGENAMNQGLTVTEPNQGTVGKKPFKL